MYYLFLADGFEETEALVTLDMLRRAEIEVKTVGVDNKTVKGTHGISVISDIAACELDLSDCDGVILPGGMPGTENLYRSEFVRNTVNFCAKKNLLIAAICAAPIIFGRMELLKGRRAVCFPGFDEELHGAEVLSDACCVDENVITAKGAGCVFQFSYSIIEYVNGRSVADNVISQIQYSPLI